jgi:hypothetical protein
MVTVRAAWGGAPNATDCAKRNPVIPSAGMLAICAMTTGIMTITIPLGEGECRSVPA